MRETFCYGDSSDKDNPNLGWDDVLPGEMQNIWKDGLMKLI